MKYRPELDGLRAIAASAVVLAHTRTFLLGGGRGVDVFFVLSGYLISGMLLANPSYDEFMLRRARRLLPALIFFVVTYVAFAPLILPDPALHRAVEAVIALTYNENWYQAFANHETGLVHTWSLAVEWQFYLLWPLILPRVIKSGNAVAWLLCAWAALTALRFVTPSPAGDYATPFHASGLVLGAVVALRPPIHRLGGLALAMLGVVFWFGARDRGYWDIPAAEIATALLIPALLSSGWLQRAFAWPPLVFLGLISYGIYLWHFPVAIATRDHWWSAPVSFAFAICMATASYFWIEAPFRNGTPRNIARQLLGTRGRVGTV